MITAAKVNNHTISIATILSPDRIQAHVNASSKKRILEIVSQLIGNTLVTYDYKTLFEQFLIREKLGSTAIGHGVAIPHIRLDQLDRATAAFITLNTPVNFNGPENHCADLIFALVVPTDWEQQHLNLLKQVSSTLGQESTRQALRQNSSVESIYQLLTGEPHHGSND